MKGKCILPVKHKGKIHRLLFFVGPSDNTSLLGRADCERLELVKRIYSVEPEIEIGDYNELLTEFHDIFEGLGCLPGKHKIIIKEDAQPIIHPCRKTPFAVRDKLKIELNRMVDPGVIEKVGEPTEWVNSLVTVLKKNGDIRVCLDPRDLNRAIKREHYKLPTREEVMAQFSNARYFSKLDASQGFWQLCLDERSSFLTTFNSPFGRYRYLRLPFGISSAPEVYHKIIHEIFEGIEGVDTSMDDIIIWGKTKEEHDRSLRQVFERAQQKGLKLQKAKCQLGVKELIFLGDKLTTQGIKPDERKISAIMNMERSKSKKDIQRFFGMVTYNAKWIPDLSKKTEPLRQLLDKNVEWQWNHEQEKSWQLLRAILTTEPVLQYFDPERPIKISSDASKDGLGAVILQLHGNEWKPVAYASRSMTDAEKRYAQIEKELLGIAYGCCRFHQFIYGGQIIVETDHKPLVSLAKKPLNDCPLRIQRIMLQLQKYDLEINYTPGKYLLTADSLSRAVDSTEKDSSLLTMQINAHVHSVIRLMPISNKRMNEVKEKTNNDDVLIELRNTIINGWPDQKRNCNPEVVDFWNVRDELSVADGIVLKGMKIVIPLALRQLILGKIHEGHMGIEKCKRRGREVVYWPDINDDIECMVRKCSTCLKYSNKQQREPLIPHELPNYPWQKIGSDLFMDQGKTYLIVTDYYSGYPEVMQLQTITSRAIVTSIKTIFARFGIPEVLISDNGPQYDCREFKEFSK